ncbi:Disease resistance response protein [Parasponia andersonii]|uniref:Dirigent protein n=1 Tax=Parasponia andersonii TaxID=3476 RepID=A0A2P5DSC1_PARAD|nr:Disease resistance response protein [Parasponia andersonii]
MIIATLDSNNFSGNIPRKKPRPKPTAVRVANAKITNTSLTGFDTVNARDGGSVDHVGSAQGLYPSASQSDWRLIIVVSYVFTDGKYNGSTISAFWDETLLFGSERCRWSAEVGFSDSPEAMFKQGLIRYW